VALICDTGPLYAAMDRSDADHGVCSELLGSDELVVPSPVVVELDWLASARLGPDPFRAFLADVEDGMITVVELGHEDYGRVRELLSRYADLNLGFVDAAVLAVVERLNEKTLATLDRRHFSILRPRHVAALELVPA
jgi:predicted nucleic acid-binding protein